MDEEIELNNGANTVSERRLQTPVRNIPVKRKFNVRDEEQDTKKIICGDLTEKHIDIGSLRAR